MMSSGRRSGGFVMFILYVVFALYLINKAINFISLPASFASIDKWISLVAGIFLILGGINSMRIKRYNY